MYEYLKSKWNGHSDDEQEEGHNKIGEVAAVPRRVPNLRPLASGIIHQYHQLKSRESLERERERERQYV